MARRGNREFQCSEREIHVQVIGVDTVVRQFDIRVGIMEKANSQLKKRIPSSMSLSNMMPAPRRSSKFSLDPRSREAGSRDIGEMCSFSTVREKYARPIPPSRKNRLSPMDLVSRSTGEMETVNEMPVSAHASTHMEAQIPSTRPARYRPFEPFPIMSSHAPIRRRSGSTPVPGRKNSRNWTGSGPRCFPDTDRSLIYRALPAGFPGKGRSGVSRAPWQ